jgi:hypothetical protein
MERAETKEKRTKDSESTSNTGFKAEQIAM